MPRARGLARTQYADVEMFGLDELQRGLRRASKDARREVAQGSKRVADHVFKDMKRRARVVPHARQYALVAPSLRAVTGRTPRVRLGGKKKAKVSRRDRPSTGQFIYGVEFGGRARRRTGWGGSTMQFPPHRGRKGYVIFPTITANHEYIKRQYTREIEQVLRKI